MNSHRCLEFISKFRFALCVAGFLTADVLLLVQTTRYFTFTPIHGFILHCALCGIYSATAHYYKGTATHMRYLVLFLPVFGFTAVLVTELFSRYTRATDIIEDYDKYVHYISNLVLLKQVNFHDETNVMSTVDALQYGDRNEAKTAVVNLTSENPAVKVAILKKALSNDDHEIVHYAAATLTLMEQEYERRLDQLRGKYTPGASDHLLMELILCYNEYIHTGLLEGEALQHYRQELQSTIEFFKKNGLPHREVLVVSTENLLALERTGDAEKEAVALLAMNEELIEPYFLLMKIKFYKGDLKAVSSYARIIREKFNELPPEKNGIVAFWSVS